MSGIGERALEALGAHLQQTETGHNAGAVVEWACARWLSAARYQEMLAAGKLEWCAASVCAAFDDAESAVIHQVASTSCSTMLRRCGDHGYTVPRGEIQPGDIVWTDRDGDGKPNHVGICKSVERDADGALMRLVLRSGNSGPKADRVTDREYSFDHKILAAARLPE